MKGTLFKDAWYAQVTLGSYGACSAGRFLVYLIDIPYPACGYVLCIRSVCHIQRFLLDK